MFQSGKRVDFSALMPIFDQLEKDRKIVPHQELIDAIKCIRVEGIKTALLTNNWFVEGDRSHCPVDKSLFDVVSRD